MLPGYQLQREMPPSPKPKCSVVITASLTLFVQNGKSCPETTLTSESLSGPPVSSHISAPGPGRQKFGEVEGCW